MSTANTHVAEIRQTPAISRSSATCTFDKLNEDRALLDALCCIRECRRVLCKRKCSEIQKNGRQLEPGYQYINTGAKNECGKLSQAFLPQI